MPNPERTTEHTDKTMLDPQQLWLPVGGVLALITALFAGVWAVSGWKSALDRNTEAVQRLEQRMADVTDGHIAIRLWVAALAAKNPTLVIPDLQK